VADWLLTMKPSFLSEWSALPPKEAAQIQKKLNLLVEDPTADAKVKKQLKGMEGKLHRLRSGDYRIFYTFEQPYVSVLALRRRDDQTYNEEIEAESLGGGDVSGEPVESQPEQAWERWLEPTASVDESKPLPRPITMELLGELAVPPEFHEELLRLETEDDVLDCEAVPGDVRLRIIDALLGPPLHEVAKQPDLVVANTDDLLRYKEGELLGFLLKLSPEQEKFVAWAANGTGPTLLKGGPGTGKSTVALYRVRVILEGLRKRGVDKPRVLFTTYTNALIRFSEQLLGSLLGPDVRHVEVRTADSMAVSVLRHADGPPNICQGQDLEATMRRALGRVELRGNVLSQAAQRQTLERLGIEYLIEEITGVIHARRLASLDDYKAASRPGRKLGLNGTQREAVWRVHEALGTLFKEAGLRTWPQVRAGAAEALQRSDDKERYDAVVIDEAQDLDPSALSVLVSLCRAPNGLFLTADANQSIYGAGFRWNDVHEWLRFSGRTGVLRANHRSTREIGEAAHSYLAGGALEGDGEEATRRYVHSGPLPAVRAVGSNADEAKLVARFFRTASRELRLGLGACAVLCPTNAGAKRVASALQEMGLTARFMTPKELDLSAPGVKTLTLKSAKGLEFPIVALAGFGGKRYPYFPSDMGREEREELLERERRTMFVAMTRAMRALLVVVPAEQRSDLLRGFDKRYWNLGGEVASD